MSNIYQHNQTSASTMWTIVHGLGGPVISDVVTTIGGVATKILPLSVVHADNNTLVVTFSSAVAGKARIVGLYKTPALVPPGTVDIIV